MLRALALGLALVLATAVANDARAGAQVEEKLSASVIMGLAKSIADFPPSAAYGAQPAVRAWIDDMSPKLASRISDPATRRDLLLTVHYEATRAGLDPQLVLAVIHHESGFRKYAVSIAGARGYMQVMPFWVRQIGSDGQNLFTLRTNIRYGCTILRYYLDRESGDYFRALGRYNGSLGRPEYPNAVMAAMGRYAPSPAVRAATAAALSAAKARFEPAAREARIGGTTAAKGRPEPPAPLWGEAREARIGGGFTPTAAK
jgi:soluble lytic murein transglycosylase-like protein